MKLEEVIFDVAEALRVPVLVLVVAALAARARRGSARSSVELLRRRRRDTARLERAATARARRSGRGDLPAAQGLLWQVACSTAMATTLAVIAGRVNGAQRRGPRGQGARRLRLRLAAPAGAHPAAGPRRPGARADGDADPALAGARRARRGQRHRAEQNLRLAFSITVLGLLVGLIGFAISLVRDRLYGQDLSDLEFVAATLREETT